MDGCDHICGARTCASWVQHATCSQMLGICGGSACSSCCHILAPSLPPAPSASALIQQPSSPPPFPPPSWPVLVECVDIKGLPCLSVLAYSAAGGGLLFLGLLLLWRCRASRRAHDGSPRESEGRDRMQECSRGSRYTTSSSHSISKVQADDCRRHDEHRRASHRNKGRCGRSRSAKACGEEREEEVLSPSSANLPDGWQEHEDDSGATYYYNELSKRTSWTRPVPSPQQKATTSALRMLDYDDVVAVTIDRLGSSGTLPHGSQPLPSGWQEHVAHDGMRYYFHEQSKRTTWVRPES